MRNLTFVLALLAFGAAAFAFLVARDTSHAVRDRGDVEATFDVRLAALEQALAARDADRHAPGALAGPGPSGGPGVPGLAPSPASDLAAGARPVTASDLERRLADLEKRLAPPAGDARPGAVSTAVSAEPALATGPAWIGSVDDAAEAFELSPGQKADMERILVDAKREVDALRKVPDETGATWESVEKDVVRMENGAIHFDGSKLSTFREKVIPGRNESFGSSMRKLREDAARRLKDTLSPAQRASWEKAQTGGLLPGSDAGGGFGFMSFSTVDLGAPEPAMDGK